MSGQINNSENKANGNILKELFDIKTSLVVNTTETHFIKESINEVKVDVKDIKANYITQQQHKDLVTLDADKEIRIRVLEKNITKIMTWGSALIVLIGVLEFVIQTFIKVVH